MWKIFVFKNPVENKLRRLVPDFTLFLKRAPHKIKACGRHLSLTYLGGPEHRHRIKTNL